jgi:hypothetical protein
LGFHTFLNTSERAKVGNSEILCRTASTYFNTYLIAKRHAVKRGVVAAPPAAAMPVAQVTGWA